MDNVRIFLIFGHCKTIPYSSHGSHPAIEIKSHAIPCKELKNAKGYFALIDLGKLALQKKSYAHTYNLAFGSPFLVFANMDMQV